MLWKDVIYLTDDGTKILAANVLNYLNINLENDINFNVDLHNSENDMLDWQQASKASSVSVDTYIEEVAPRSSKNPDKVPKKSILGACENSHKATDCLSVLKKTRIENINNVIIGNRNINSLPKKIDDLKCM